MKLHTKLIAWTLILPFLLCLRGKNWAQNPEKITIGYSSMRAESAFLWLPEQTGIFRKYGLDPTIVFIPGGARMMQAIVAESVPLGAAGATLVCSAVAGGSDAVMILGITNSLTYDVWARPEIKRAEDLKGKTLAISGFGSSSHVASFLMLQHFNLEEKRDRITFVAIGDEPTRVQALMAGRIDSTIADPSVSGVLKQKGFSYLGNLKQLGVPFVLNSVITTRRFLKENPHTAEAVVKSLVEGNSAILNPANRARVTEILAQHLRLPAKEAARAYEELLPTVERRPYPSMEAVKATIEVMGLRNPKIAQLKPEDLVDVSILRKLEQSGSMR